MLCMRHTSQINGGEANEIVLLNSPDSRSSYQMLVGMCIFRFVCSNGLVCVNTVADVHDQCTSNKISLIKLVVW